MRRRTPAARPTARPGRIRDRRPATRRGSPGSPARSAVVRGPFGSSIGPSRWTAATNRGIESTAQSATIRASFLVGLALDDQAIGRHARVEGIGPRPIHVLDESPGRGPELRQIEAGIAGLERVEGPGHDGDFLVPGEVKLSLLQPPAQSKRLIAGDHAGQLRIEANSAPGAAHEGEGQSHGGAIGQEGAKHQSAVELGADHGRDRHEIRVVHDPPGAPLRILAGAIIGLRSGAADRDLLVHFCIHNR